MTAYVHAMGRSDVKPFPMPDRFRHDVTYFCTPAGDPGAPSSLGAREYWVRAEDARRIYDDGVLRIVSPLDSETTAEIEISEEQEAWLEWMLEHGIEHVRIDTA